MARPAIYTKWLEGEVTAEFAGTGIDASGRQRVSHPYSEFAWSTQYSIHPLIWDTATASGGTVTMNTTDKCATLACTGTTNSAASITTHRPLFYQPGKGQLVKFTNNFNGGGVEFSLVRRYNGTSTTITRANFDDKLDGTGDSGMTIDFSKSQFFMLDFLHLGMGDIKFYALGPTGFDIFHNIRSANVLTTLWSQYATLRFKVEIVNDGTNVFKRIGHFDDNNGIFLEIKDVPGPNSFKFYCASVESEGGHEDESSTGLYFSSDTFPTSKGVGTTETPLIAIRPKSTFNGVASRALITPQAINVISTGDILLRFYLRPTLTAPTWVSSNAGSFTEYDISATGYSGGYKVGGFPAAGAVGGRTLIPPALFKNGGLCMDSTATTGDIFLVTGVATAGTKQVHISIEHGELI